MKMEKRKEKKRERWGGVKLSKREARANAKSSKEGCYGKEGGASMIVQKQKAEVVFLGFLPLFHPSR